MRALPGADLAPRAVCLQQQPLCRDCLGHGEVLGRLQRAAVQPNVEAERHNRSGFLCAPVEGVHDTADESTTVRAQQLYLLSKPCTTEIYLHLELPAQ